MAFICIEPVEGDEKSMLIDRIEHLQIWWTPFSSSLNYFEYFSVGVLNILITDDKFSVYLSALLIKYFR
jgi:hypothetical protein